MFVETKLQMKSPKKALLKSTQVPIDALTG